MDHTKDKATERLQAASAHPSAARLTDAALAGPVSITIHNAATVNILCVVSPSAPGQPPQSENAGTGPAAPQSREGR